MNDEQRERKSSNGMVNGEVKKSDTVDGELKESCPCGEDPDDEDTFVCCDNCQQWWHAGCANLKGITGEGIGSLTSWKCPHCFVSRFTPTAVLRSVFPSLFGGDIEKPVQDAVKAEVKKAVPGIIKAVIQETVRENNFKKTFADVVKEKQEQFNAHASKTIEKTMETAINNNQHKLVEKASQKIDSDQFEREKRKRNVVFSGVPESSNSTASGRLKSDMRKVEKIIEPEEDGLVITCHRAGKKVDGKDRLLIVTMATPELAQIVHGYGSGRKCLAEKNRVIWCNPDLIKADRIANYNARKQQREKRAEVQEKKAAENKSTRTGVASGTEKVKPSITTNKEEKQNKSKQVKSKKLLETVIEEPKVVGECVTDPTNGPF